MSELEKMESVKNQSQTIGEFLDWVFEKGWHLSRYLSKEEYESDENVDICEPIFKGLKPYRRHRLGEGELISIPINIEKLLAEYFEIDLMKVEEERRELLSRLRKGEEDKR